MKINKLMTLCKKMLALIAVVCLLLFSEFLCKQRRLANMSYLNDYNALYLARYGHPEVTQEIKDSFAKRVLPAMINGAGDLVTALTNPTKSLATYDEGQYVLDIFEQLSALGQ